MDDDVKAAFGRIWPVHVHRLTRFLVGCREAFDGDLDMFLVLAVVGECTYSARHADPDLDYDDFREGRMSSTPPVKINIRSIAAFSGIPRETVRRKINMLIDRGWVTRDENEYITATRKASIDLRPLTEVSIQ